MTDDDGLRGQTRDETPAPPAAPETPAPPAAPVVPPVLAGVTDAPADTAEPQLCGVLVSKKDKDGNLLKDEAGNDVTAPCVKAKGHDKGHSWRAYTKVDTSIISLDDVNTFGSVPEDAVVESTRETEDSVVQLAINKQVEAAFAQWAKVGKPKTWGEVIKKKALCKYRVTPENQAAWRSMLRVAANRTENRTDIPHVSVRIHPKLHNHVDGHKELWWYAREHLTRESAESGETPAPVESAETTA